MSCLRASSGPLNIQPPGAGLPGDQPSAGARCLRTDHHPCGDLEAAIAVDRVRVRSQSLACRAAEHRRTCSRR
jgi:hypothetical protein